jgi:hypothetical protein
VRLYDEQGTSGATLGKRTVTLQALDDLEHGSIQGIAAYDVKRLTRDQQAEQRRSPAQLRLDYLEERAKHMASAYLGMEVPSAALAAQLEDAEREINRLREQVADELDARLVRDEYVKACRQLAQPLARVDRLTPEQQAHLYRLLFRVPPSRALGADWRRVGTSPGTPRPWAASRSSPMTRWSCVWPIRASGPVVKRGWSCAGRSW